MKEDHQRRKQNAGLHPIKIRFEMMFNVRCLQCKNSIGKGVRFNAKKKQIGKYLSTNIYEFTMNCHLCDNKFVIRTDPKSCDYTLVSGVEKRIEEFDPKDAEVREVPDSETRQKLDTNAFFKLENVTQDKEKADFERPRLEKLLEIKEQNKDDYNLNSLLRKRHREKRAELIEKEELEKRPKNFGIQMIDKLDAKDQKIVKQVGITQSNNRYAKSRLEVREQIKQQSIFGGQLNKQLPTQLNQLPVGIKRGLEQKAILTQIQQGKQDLQRKQNIMKHLERIKK